MFRPASALSPYSCSVFSCLTFSRTDIEHKNEQTDFFRLLVSLSLCLVSLLLLTSLFGRRECFSVYFSIRRKKFRLVHCVLRLASYGIRPTAPAPQSPKDAKISQTFLPIRPLQSWPCCFFEVSYCKFFGPQVSICGQRQNRSSNFRKLKNQATLGFLTANSLPLIFR